MDLGLKGRAAIVPASSQGLGKAIALGLAREGANVAICARSEAALANTAAEIRRETGVQVVARALDVTVPEQVHGFVREAAQRFGRIDICLANAGGPPSKSFAETTIEDWRRTVDLNLMSAVYFARETLPLMQERRWGRFIALTSMTVKQPVEGLVLSNSVRSAVSGLIKTLANEYGPYNVLVNSVCPGYIATARLLELGDVLAARQRTERREIEEHWGRQAALGRIGQPEEFASVVVFLASERASYITGAAIQVDGGTIKSVY